jgi:hypothetical protein
MTIIAAHCRYLRVNLFQFFPNAFHVIVIIVIRIAILAQGCEMRGFLIFLVNYLSAHFFVFAKNGAKPCVASHGPANARRIPEQFLPYFVPAPKRFKLFQVVARNAAPVACYMLCRWIHFTKQRYGVMQNYANVCII